MRTTLVIFRKELLDTLRDRRTLISMIVVPLLLFPLLIGISSRVISTQMQEAREKQLRIGLITRGNAAAFRDRLLSDENIRVDEALTLDAGTSLVAADSLDAFLVIDDAFDKDVVEHRRGTMTLYFKSAEGRSIEKDRILEHIRSFEHSLQSARFKALKIDESVITVLNLRQENLASAQEKLAEGIGGFLPYLFIIFCFMGSMYPAIDLAAGEKERGTLETLLSSPAGRLEILLGKFGVVVLAGILTAIVAMLGLYLGITQVEEIPAELLGTILGILELRSILLLLSLLLPLTVFFAAILLSLSIFAKSYKEAQSIITPMMIVVIIPAFLGLMPGMALNSVTALVPILNVSMTTKAIIAGYATPLLLAEVYLSLFLFAGVSLYICSKVFERESVIFRS